jgi:hypothetical protein
VWVTAHEVFEGCGLQVEAAHAKAAGAGWVRRMAAQWTDEGDRTAWLNGQPLHRALLRS